MHSSDPKEEKLLFDIRFWLTVGSAIYLFLAATARI